jgi:hypothetical protein
MLSEAQVRTLYDHSIIEVTAMMRLMNVDPAIIERVRSEGVGSIKSFRAHPGMAAQFHGALSSALAFEMVLERR